MAPREATGTFPDQFLTFDYDASMPMGVGGAPIPHNPEPAVPLPNPLDTDMSAGDDPAAVLPQEALTGGAGMGGAHGSNNSSESIRPSSSAVANVDPLSIDPTNTNNNNNNNNSTGTTGAAGNSSSGSNHSHPTATARPSRAPHFLQLDSHHSDSITGSLPATSLRPLLPTLIHHSPSAAASEEDNNNNNDGHDHDQLLLASPLSTGSSVFHSTTTAPNSPNQNDTGVPTPVRFRVRVARTAAFSASSNNGISTAAARRRNQMMTSQTNNTTLQGQSVLDSTTSIESDDDDGLPGLDRTFDSLSSSVQQLEANWTAYQQQTSNAALTKQDDDDDVSVNSKEENDNYDDDNSEACPDSQMSSNASAASSFSAESMRMIYRNGAFDMSPNASMSAEPLSPPQSMVVTSASHAPGGTPTSPNSIMLSFGPNTTVSDLKYFAERGCIVALLQALTTPRLVTLGTRMLADYAKLSQRRVAVASNRRILEFVQRTMLQVTEHADWLGREYAVETIRSLTATEESDRYLMQTHGLLTTLALVARGGPFVTHVQDGGVRCTVPLASEKARLHACIAIMNLSCGKANKIEIAKIPDVLEAMRDVMVNSLDEARLKATTCVKNLSNADANDAALLGTPGLVEALGHVAAATCSPETGATPCTTNACLALMNLSISKANKHRVFRTPGVMDALMTVLERTTAQGSSTEARIKACSALSNLAIGYDNKIPMFAYPGFVDAILNVIQTDTGEARTKACSILWSFAAEMRNQVPVVERGDILPVLVQVAEEDGTTEARFKCVAALTLLAESLENAISLLESGALAPLMDILHEAGPDPTQWKGQTASWCVGFLMNIAQSDEAVPALREAGVVELLAPLLTLDHYQSLKAAMAVTFVCRYDEGDECYDLLRKTENVIPKIISLLHNTLSGRGGNGYKYGVFTLRSSVGCISALASGPDFMKERIATGPVYESLLRVVTDFCVDGGTPGAIVGGGRDDALSATLAIRALQSLTGHLIPIAGSSSLPFGQSMEECLLTALISFEKCIHPEIKDSTRNLATDAKIRIQGGRKTGLPQIVDHASIREGEVDMGVTDVTSVAGGCCGFETIPGIGNGLLQVLSTSLAHGDGQHAIASPFVHQDGIESGGLKTVQTFLLADSTTGRRFVVPADPSGGRAFNDNRVWCYRRGRFCEEGEEPDLNFVWTDELQQAYETALALHREVSQEH